MGFQKCSRVFGGGIGIIANVSAVGRPHVHQVAAALTEDIGYSETTADLHCLAPGDHDLASGRQCRQPQQQGRCVVVDYEGGLGAGNLLEQGLQVRLPRTPAAGGQVDFQVGVPFTGGVGGGQGSSAKGRATQVGVNHHAGSVYDGSR